MAAPAPYIVARGRKGGSTIAVAIIHALLLLSSTEARVVKRAVTVIGIGDDGCAGLSARAANAVAAAQVLAGGERHLAFFPQFAGERIVLKDRLGAALDRVAALADEHNVVVLASGDPLFFGVGALVAKKRRRRARRVPAGAVERAAGVRPRRASSGTTPTVLSLHGRAREGLLTRAAPRRARSALLTDEESSPRWIAVAPGRARRARLARLGLREPRRRRRARAPLRRRRAGRVRRHRAAQRAAARSATATGAPPPAISFLHEDEFAKRMPKKGLITKREARLLSLAMLQLRPDSVVWDIGAGSGSVAIEAALLGLRRAASSPSRSIPRASRSAARTCARIGVDNVRVVAGRAPEALAELPRLPTPSSSAAARASMAEIIEVALDAAAAGRAAGRQRHHARERRRSLRRAPRQRTRSPRCMHAQRLARRAARALHALGSAEPDPHLRGDAK